MTVIEGKGITSTMQRINTANVIGLQAELVTLRESYAALRHEWRMDKDLARLLIDQIRINPLQAEQHPTTVRGVTVVQSADCPVGQIQLIAETANGKK